VLPPDPLFVLPPNALPVLPPDALLVIPPDPLLLPPLDWVLGRPLISLLPQATTGTLKTSARPALRRTDASIPRSQRGPNKSLRSISVTMTASIEPSLAICDVLPVQLDPF
jgi:hypothetical protein